MDWQNLRDQVSNISLYDIKAGVRKVQNGECILDGPPESRIDISDSCHELHRDGGEGQGGHQQRAMGSIFIVDAGDCQWHIPLVRVNSTMFSLD